LQVEFQNGSTATFAHREEPKMLLEWSDAAGEYVPTHLFNVVIEKQAAPKDGWQHLDSYILAQPLAGHMQPPPAAVLQAAAAVGGSPPAAAAARHP